MQTIIINTPGPQGRVGNQGPSGSQGPPVDTSSLVTTSSFNEFTSSVVTTSSFNDFTGSVVTTSSFNNFTSSYYQDSSSFNNRINNITFDTSSLVSTSSFNNFTSSYYQESASFDTRINNIIFDTSSLVNTSSFNSFTSSIVTTSSFNSFTGSYNTGSFTGSFIGSLNSFNNEIINVASSSNTSSAATVGQLNNLSKLYPLNITQNTSSHTGTSDPTITYSFQIPANTIGAYDALEIYGLWRKTTGGTGTHTVTVYLNTSNTIGGDAIFNQVQGGATTMMGEAFCKWLDASNYIAKNAAQTPWGSNAGGIPLAYNKNTAASIWVIVAITLTTITDVITQYMVEVVHHKYR